MIEERTTAYNLALLRKALGLTAEELANKVGLNTVTYYRYETGKRKVRKETKGLIEEGLNLYKGTLDNAYLVNLYCEKFEHERLMLEKTQQVEDNRERLKTMKQPKSIQKVKDKNEELIKEAESHYRSASLYDHLITRYTRKESNQINLSNIINEIQGFSCIEKKKTKIEIYRANKVYTIQREDNQGLDLALISNLISHEVESLLTNICLLLEEKEEIEELRDDEGYLTVYIQEKEEQEEESEDDILKDEI